MEITFDYPGAVAGAIVFPGWEFPDVPLQSNQIKETIQMTGSSTTATAFTGILDNPENS